MAESMDETLKRKLTEAFVPIELSVINQSHLHHGHAGSPNTGHSHYKIRIKSPVFNNLTRIERQRRVHDVLKQELAQGIHALSLTIEGC